MADSANAFDILILGGGSAGYAAALRSVQLGKKVGLIEAEKVGGTCLHWGCIPTKAYLHSAEVAEEARESEKYGVKVSYEGVDMAKVRDYKDSIIAGKFKGLQGLLKMKGVTVIDGFGKLTGEKTIEVDGTEYTGEHIILASGSVSKTMGLDIGGRVMTSTQALELDYLPKSAIVLGGGVIGSEFASMWNSMGVDVTIIEGLPHLVPNEDPAIIKVLERTFKKRGIKFNLGTFFEKVEQSEDSAKVTLADGKEFEADIVLVGVKPKDMVATLTDLASSLRPETVVVSVAAGVTAATMAAVLPAGQPIVRTMPNTPLTVGSGVVGVAPGPGVTEEQTTAVRALFEGSGLVVPVAEEQLSAVVATAGSAPAYVFLLAELIAAHGAEMGLDAASAEAMAAATVKGAGIMLQQEGARAEALRKAVMSPNGTTEKAVEAFLDGGMGDLVNRAMDAAAQRDKEMAEEFGA